MSSLEGRYNLCCRLGLKQLIVGYLEVAQLFMGAVLNVKLMWMKMDFLALVLSCLA